MELWQVVFLVFVIVSMTVAITWDSVLGNKYRNIETRQFADPKVRPHMDLSSIPGFGRQYRARQHALRLAEPERSAALAECDKLRLYVRVVVGIIVLVFLAMLVSLLVS